MITETKKIIPEFLSKGLFQIKGGKITILKDLDYIMYPTNGVVINFQQIGLDFGSKAVFGMGYDMGQDFRDIIREKISDLKCFIPEKFQSDFFVLQFSGHGEIINIKKTAKKLSFELQKNSAIDFANEKYAKNSFVIDHYAGFLLPFFDLPISKKYKVTKKKNKYKFEYDL